MCVCVYIVCICVRIYTHLIYKIVFSKKECLFFSTPSFVILPHVVLVRLEKTVTC